MAPIRQSRAACWFCGGTFLAWRPQNEMAWSSLDDLYNQRKEKGTAAQILTSESLGTYQSA